MRMFVILFMVGFGSFSFLWADEGKVERAKVVCYGDSITKRGYNVLLGEALGVDTVMSGVAGHSTAQALGRLKRDVLDHDPDVVVIFFGTNDLRVDAPRVYVTLKDYEKNLVTMVERCEEVGAKVVLCTLPPIDVEKYFTRHEKLLYDEEGGLEKMIGNYRGVAVKVARKHRLALVDLNVELAKEPKWMSPDGVHPSKFGTEVIARLIGAKVRPLLEVER